RTCGVSLRRARVAGPFGEARERVCAGGAKAAATALPLCLATSTSQNFPNFSSTRTCGVSLRRARVAGPFGEARERVCAGGAKAAATALPLFLATSTLFPYTTLFRSRTCGVSLRRARVAGPFGEARERVCAGG